MGVEQSPLACNLKMMKTTIIALCLFAAVAADADAKADASADAHYQGAYGYGGYGLAGYRGYGYRNYGYGYPSAYSHGSYYGKRSADAEPTAEASADAHYGAYGYGAYGYGGYPSYP